MSARSVSSQILDEAIQWQLLLDSGEATAGERDAWMDWIKANPDHELVWRQLESLDNELLMVPRQQTAPLRQFLEGSIRSDSRNPNLRKTLGTLAVLLTLGGGSLFALNLHRPLTGLLADHATGTGEQQTLTLPDNTLLVLNSRTSVDINFNQQQRRIHLRSGEIYIQSGHPDGEQRPLVVVTDEGSLRALGTGFVVNRDKEITRLDVTEAAVMARPNACEISAEIVCAKEQQVAEGYRVEITPGSVSYPQKSASSVDAWRNGLLVFNNQSLSEVAAELSRYKPGLITVAPEVAQLRVTATLPLNSPDLALTALADALPVHLSKRTGLWIHIEARDK